MVFGIDVDIHIVGVGVIGIDIYVYKADVALLVAGGRLVVMVAVIGGDTGIASGGLGGMGLLLETGLAFTLDAALGYLSITFSSNLMGYLNRLTSISLRSLKYGCFYAWVEVSRSSGLYTKSFSIKSQHSSLMCGS